MKLLKKTALALALASVVGSTWAGWYTWQYRGKVVADGGTIVKETGHANNTWDDWVWRGKWEDKVFPCAPWSQSCTTSWNFSKTVGYSHTVGWSVGGGFGIEKWGLDGSVEGAYQNSKTWTQIQSEGFGFSTTVGPGYWAQPVIVAVRRWKKGHFEGGHFLDPYASPDRGYYYSWGWGPYGSWQGSQKEWGYRMIQVTRNQWEL